MSAPKPKLTQGPVGKHLVDMTVPSSSNATECSLPPSTWITPASMPRLAMTMMTLRGATLEPMDELRKLTAATKSWWVKWLIPWRKSII